MSAVKGEHMELLDPKLLNVILGILLAVSELLPFFPKVAANGIVQFVVDLLKKYVPKK